MDDASLSRIIERAEMNAWRDFIAAAPDETRARTGIRIEPVADGIAIVAPGLPNILYNRAFGFGLEAPIDESTIDRTLALYRRDAPFSIQPCEHARPPAIGDWLRARGIESYFDWVIWVRGRAAPPSPTSTTLRVERVGARDAGVVADVALTVFGDSALERTWVRACIDRPGWSHYLVYDDATPVAVGALYVRDRLGWLGWGGTLETHRRRGAQGALLAKRVEDGIAQGCDWLTVETADDLPDRPSGSYRNVARVGFRVLHRRPSHAYFPAGPG
jgi:hypothetical protein